ncbi:unnamed protein product, partial [Phaeothamnion confervicola]
MAAAAAGVGRDGSYGANAVVLDAMMLLDYGSVPSYASAAAVPGMLVPLAAVHASDKMVFVVATLDGDDYDDLLPGTATSGGGGSGRNDGRGCRNGGPEPLSLLQLRWDVLQEFLTREGAACRYVWIAEACIPKEAAGSGCAGSDGASGGGDAGGNVVVLCPDESDMEAISVAPSTSYYSVSCYYSEDDEPAASAIAAAPAVAVTAGAAAGGAIAPTAAALAAAAAAATG